MTEQEFQQFRELVYKRTHIFCADSQKPLFERKIRSRIAALHVPSFQAYYNFITTDYEGSVEFCRLIDKIAVHETSFFRLRGHFRGLATTVFPELVQMLQQQSSTAPIQLWSAGCSTGEEPYSIGITFLEWFNSQKRPAVQQGLHILATDISATAIENARTGIYTQAQVAKIQKSLLDKYFIFYDNHYHICAEVKKLVQFEVFNFVNLDTPPAPSFDIIFCRNVLIYFGRTAQEKLLTQLIQLLPEKGYLFLGDAESIHTFPQSAKKLSLIEINDAIMYQKRGENADDRRNFAYITSI